MSRLLRFTAVAVVLVILCGTGCRKNTAPEAPQIQGPVVAKPGATLTYGFTSVDPDGDDVSYMISWGDDTPMEWSSDNPSDTQFVLTHVYADSGAYFVKAKAKDNNDAESAWSDSIQVAVGFLPPGTPLRPSGPTACTTKAAYAYRAKSVHPLGDSVCLQFFWGDTVGDWGPMVASNEFYQTTHTFETVGTYRIAARARDARGLESGWSDSLTVTVDTLHAPPGGAPRDLVLTAATDSTVSLTWSAPSDSTPNRYVIYFQRTAVPYFDSVGTTQSLSFVHDPAHSTGAYQVTAVFDSARYPSAQTPSTVPVATGLISIPELNGGVTPGLGWDRSNGLVTLYDMTVRDSAKKVDLYITDFAQGIAGPDYHVASPDTSRYDPGDTIPLDGLYETRFTHLDSLATEDSILPFYLQSRYRKSSILDSLPRFVACRTWDEHFALLRVSDVDTGHGTARIETWFQLIQGLRLIEH